MNVIRQSLVGFTASHRRGTGEGMIEIERERRARSGSSPVVKLAFFILPFERWRDVEWEEDGASGK